MQGENVVIVGNWDQYNRCNNSAAGFLFPGYFDI